MVWREFLGTKRVGSRQFAVVQGTSSSWTLSQLENPRDNLLENDDVKLDELDKMVAMECTGCTGNLGDKIRKKMGKWTNRSRVLLVAKMSTFGQEDKH